MTKTMKSQIKEWAAKGLVVRPMTAEECEDATCDNCGCNLNEGSGGGWANEDHAAWCGACLDQHQVCPRCELTVHEEEWDAADGHCLECAGERTAERLDTARSEIVDLMDGCEDEDLLDRIKAMLSK